MDADKVCTVLAPATSQGLFKAEIVQHKGIAGVTKRLIAINASGCESKEEKEERKGNFLNVIHLPVIKYEVL